MENDNKALIELFEYFAALGGRFSTYSQDTRLVSYLLFIKMLYGKNKK